MPLRHSLLIVSAAVLLEAPAARSAETLRNPPGTATPPSTLRNPVNVGATPQQEGDRSGPAISSEETRPARGSNIDDPPSRGSFATSGPVPVRPGSSPTGTVSGGAGAPSVVNPVGANAGTTPQGTSGSRPNGGTPDAGSKAAPMQANGVRKVE